MRSKRHQLIAIAIEFVHTMMHLAGVTRIAIGETDIDECVDIYGIGCVANWLLTGKRVFGGETPMAEAIHHSQSQPVPPSERTQISVPESLEMVILSCLEKDPADRPQSAHELGMLFSQSIPEGDWNQEKAVEWWELHIPKHVAGSVTDPNKGPSSEELLKIN